MSLLSKLMGGTFESNRADGDSLLAEQAYGEALLAYERALAKARGKQHQGSPAVAEVRERVRTCRLELARARLAAADALIAEGDSAGASEQLEDAAAICDEAEIAEAIAERKRHYEAEDARRLVGDAEEMTEEELLAVLAGTWTEDQADEYAEMPDAFREALLLGHDGEHERAAELLARVIDSPGPEIEPRYAFAELGQQLAAAGEDEAALDAFDRFVAAVEGDDDAVEVVVAALTAKGRCLLNLKRPEEAEEQLLAATRAAPESHVTFLNLGTLLRARGDFERSLKALQTAAELMGQMHPDFRVIREMGFTYLALDRKQEAEETLYAVIEHHASRGTHDQIDPAAAVALAKIYEEKGDPIGASDLYRHLAQGYDTANHFAYNLEAARLLREGGADPGLVERYLARAAELARDVAELGLVDRQRPGETG